jgi:hypothetical protein
MQDMQEQLLEKRGVKEQSKRENKVKISYQDNDN